MINVPAEVQVVLKMKKVSFFTWSRVLSRVYLSQYLQMSSIVSSLAAVFVAKTLQSETGTSQLNHVILNEAG